MPLLIADLNNWTGDIRRAVDACAKDKRIVGVIFKVSEGLGYVDPTAAPGVARARWHGLLVGGYHFFHPLKDVDTQARLFASAGAGATLWRKGDIRPVLDYERDSDNRESAHRDAFYSRLRHYNGHRSALYTGGYFNSTGWLRPPNRLDRGLWVAGYPDYHPPLGYGRPWLHQFTDRFPVGAYRVDCSVVKGAVPRLTLRRNLCTAPNS